MAGITLAFPEPHVAVLTIDRPPVNALDRETRRCIVQAMDELQDLSDVRAIVLAATGHVFCAGADIKEKAELDASGPGAMHAANRLTRDLFLAFLESRKPVVAAVNGPALGAGVVLLAGCDVIVCADDAVWALPEIDVGQGGGASFLQRIMPLHLVRKMALTGDRIPATEFHRLGIVDQLVPREAVLDAAVAVASRIAAKSPAAVRAVRDSFLTVEALDVYDGYRVEQRYIDQLASSPDGVEARRAFLEKRPARF